MFDSLLIPFVVAITAIVFYLVLLHPMLFLAYWWAARREIDQICLRRLRQRERAQRVEAERWFRAHGIRVHLDSDEAEDYCHCWDDAVSNGLMRQEDDDDEEEEEWTESHRS